VNLNELTAEMHRFVTAKGWYAPDSKRPQTPRNLAVSLAIESAEVLEHFQWEGRSLDTNALAGELADVALYLLQLASLSGIDLEQAIMSKLDLNYLREWDGRPIGQSDQESTSKNQ
jgi:NTP pyrophosphatase (non-canonical NTP hydrolase)